MEARAKDKSTLRDELHQAVDQLPDGELDAAHRFVSYLRDEGDPFLKKVREAPPDDEPVSAEEEDGATEAREELERGEAISHEEMKSEFDW